MLPLSRVGEVAEVCLALAQGAGGGTVSSTLGLLIGLALAVGIIGLILIIVLTPPQTAAPPAPAAAAPTAAPAAPPTAAPAAAAPAAPAVAATTAPAAAATAPAAPAAAGPSLEIASASGLTLAFGETTMEAPANSQVSVTFRNASDTLPHNWVLVRGDDAVAEEVDRGAVGKADFLPADKSKIIAATKMVNPGESDTITFTTPAAGTYTFLCTFPGHFQQGMKGTFTVE